MWIKEDEFLLVARKMFHKGLETVAIHFEAPSAVGVVPLLHLNALGEW